MRDRSHILFFCLAVGVFVVAHIGFEIIARLWIGHSAAWEAVSETLYYAAIQPLGTVMLLAPFVLLGWMAGSLAKKQTMKRGNFLFVGGVVPLSLIYLRGHIGAEQAMQLHQWTAAAVSIGLIPFQSIPVLAVVLVTRLLLGRKPDEKEV
jgi:hypothetical protein